MDPVRPPTVWVDGRCYRVASPPTTTSTTNYAEADTYGYEESVYQDEVDCAAEQEDFTVEQISNGRFQTSFHVANSYIPYLIGGKGSTKNRIERETFTTLKFPGKGQEGDIVVMGRDVRTVRQARIKLEMLVEQARKRQNPTHFISIPANTPAIQEKFLEFKKEVLEKCGDSRGVEESIFQEPIKLHLTLCVLALADERERQQALDALKSCSEMLRRQLGEEKLRLEMKGIEIMNDDPGEVDVLYGRVNALSWSHSLQTIADSLVGELMKTGLVTRSKERVKLHVTLMNSSFRQQGDDSGEDVTPKARESFCAKNILKEFGDYEFGVFDVEEVHLSILHTATSTKYYTATGKISTLPEKPS
ncbi:activating signal cointegrator 1 complex subunit 1-like isoform X2 [Eriocheir sinensis]|uniref:activating signal cointegrator 1 complex subunit 1-like isoform X2 n=1 Tax=Eriocheir sinensis TaxID=95602 RepID=UPI0021C8CCF9|nr:activating signal cointegrator 1 complex subunit 1-like isoform X2 [Eriocheir sinensis]